MVFLSLPLYKGQTITTLAEKGPKRFSRFMRHGTRGGQADNGLKGDQVEIGSQVEKGGLE